MKHGLPISVAISIGGAVAGYALTIWAAQIAWQYELAPMGMLALGSFVATVVAMVAAVCLAETYRGNY